MTDDRAKTPRTLLVADHLWEALAIMAVEMGSDRDALINQALYTFARLNGFLLPADLKRLGSSEPAARPEPSARRTAPRALSQSSPPTMVADERPARPTANAERVAELAHQLGGSVPARAASSPPPPVEARASQPFDARASQPFDARPSQPPDARDSSEPSPVQVDDSLLGDEGQKATSMELPNLGDPGKKAAPMSAPNRTLSDTPAEAVDPAVIEQPEVRSGPRTLVLLADGRELERVVKDRFLIGRGKHCDLIINSGKVSREHAAITREGGEYFIEDLGSSNGTWHDKRRITRRQIEDGDEYFICAEKLSCALR
jgi:hypothetical protein